MQQRETSPEDASFSEDRLDSVAGVARRIFGAEDKASVERWTRYWSETRERNLSLLESYAPIVPLDFRDKAVLDVGCGSGGLGELVGSDCQLYVGGDYHRHVLQFAEAAPGRRYLQCSGTKLPFRSESFDFVFAFDVIEHLVGGLPWQIDFLSEIRRVLRPSGMAFLSTPNRYYPCEGHTGLYFPQYLPIALADRYIGWRNPGFLKEHRTFREIQILSPRVLRSTLRKTGLSFLHQLPCGSDRFDFLRLFPFRGLFSYVGLGWYPHAEFWGVLVRTESRQKLRLKLRTKWFYEKGQSSGNPAADFGPSIDFDEGLFNQQLGPGWFWHEREDKVGFRWTAREAVCYLQAREERHYLAVHGFSANENRLEFWVEGVRVGERPVKAGSEFQVHYLIPQARTANQVLEARIVCSDVHESPIPGDERSLGVMMFSVGLQTSLPAPGSGDSEP